MDHRGRMGVPDEAKPWAAPMFDRRFLLAAGSAAMLSACSGRGARRPDVDFIIPYAPGGGFDSYVRTVLPVFQKQLGVQVHPDNIDGAAGARAANALYRGKRDGSVISIVNIPGTMILQQQGGLPFDLAQLTWLANMGRDSYGLAVAASSPIKTIDDLRALGLFGDQDRIPPARHPGQRHLGLQGHQRLYRSGDAWRRRCRGRVAHRAAGVSRRGIDPCAVHLREQGQPAGGSRCDDARPARSC